MALSVQPLVGVKMHEKLVNTDGIVLTCCQQDATSCCNSDAHDSEGADSCDTKHKCSELCDCVALGMHAFRIAGFPGIELPVVVLEEAELFESPYHFSLHHSIWHPPRI